MSKSIIIAGLPGSGKSTFIAALWSCLEERFDNMKLSLEKLPKNSEYLYELSSNWNNLKEVDHTSVDRPQINIPLSLNGSGETIDLYIPDYRGETFKGLILNRNTNRMKEIISQSHFLLFFISRCHPGTFIDDYGSDESNEGKNEADEIKLDSRLMSNDSVDALNMLVLKWLKQNGLFDKIILCISAWDTKSDYSSAEEYVSMKSPGFYNFIKYHFPTAEFMGVSAQGYDYDSQKKNEFEEKTLEGKRAYIVEKNDVKFDISLPIYKLIVE